MPGIIDSLFCFEEVCEDNSGLIEAKKRGCELGCRHNLLVCNSKSKKWLNVILI
jgi:hypothetical protein